MKLRSSTKRCGATLLCTFFFISQTVLAHAFETNFWKERKTSFPMSDIPLSHASLLGKSASLPALEKNLSNLLTYLPTHLGSIRKMTFPEETSSPNLPALGRLISVGDPKVVLHFQDVHMNSEAQANMAEALNRLIEAGLIDVVALEGADGAISLDRFRKNSTPEVRQVAADYLLKIGKISGPIHSGLTHRASVPTYVGIDDKKLYRSNVHAYQQAREIQPQLKSDIQIKKEVLHNKKNRSLNPQLLKFETARQHYSDGKTSLGVYLQTLNQEDKALPLQLEMFGQALEAEAQLDFGRIEHQRAAMLDHLIKKLKPETYKQLLDHTVAYRLGQINHAAFYNGLIDLCNNQNIPMSHFPALRDYIQYILLVDQIDVDRVMDELRELENKLVDKWVKNKIERKLIEQSRELELTEKLVEFSLTPKEWEEYKKTVPSFPNGGDDRLSSFEKFYSAAEARDEAMAQNLQEVMTDENAKVAVLVTGGFHSPGLNRHFQKADITSVQFIPKITKVDFDGGAKYLSVFTREKTPLENLFKGKKLFTAPPPLIRSVVAGWFGIAREALTLGNAIRDHEFVSRLLGRRITAQQFSTAPTSDGVQARVSGSTYDVEVENNSRIRNHSINSRDDSAPIAFAPGTAAFPWFFIVRLFPRTGIWVAATLGAVSEGFLIYWILMTFETVSGEGLMWMTMAGLLLLHWLAGVFVKSKIKLWEWVHPYGRHGNLGSIRYVSKIIIPLLVSFTSLWAFYVPQTEALWYAIVPHLVVNLILILFQSPRIWKGLKTVLKILFVAEPDPDLKEFKDRVPVAIETDEPQAGRQLEGWTDRSIYARDAAFVKDLIEDGSLGKKVSQSLTGRTLIKTDENNEALGRFNSGEPILMMADSIISNRFGGLFQAEPYFIFSWITWKPLVGFMWWFQRWFNRKYFNRKSRFLRVFPIWKLNMIGRSNRNFWTPGFKPNLHYGITKDDELKGARAGNIYPTVLHNRYSEVYIALMEAKEDRKPLHLVMDDTNLVLLHSVIQLVNELEIKESIYIHFLIDSKSEKFKENIEKLRRYLPRAQDHVKVELVSIFEKESFLEQFRSSKELIYRDLVFHRRDTFKLEFVPQFLKMLNEPDEELQWKALYAIQKIFLRIHEEGNLVLTFDNLLDMSQRRWKLRDYLASFPQIDVNMEDVNRKIKSIVGSRPERKYVPVQGGNYLMANETAFRQGMATEDEFIRYVIHVLSRTKGFVESFPDAETVNDLLKPDGSLFSTIKEQFLYYWRRYQRNIPNHRTLMRLNGTGIPVHLVTTRTKKEIDRLLQEETELGANGIHFIHFEDLQEGTHGRTYYRKLRRSINRNLGTKEQADRILIGYHQLEGQLAAEEYGFYSVPIDADTLSLEDNPVISEILLPRHLNTFINELKSQFNRTDISPEFRREILGVMTGLRKTQKRILKRGLRAKDPEIRNETLRIINQTLAHDLGDQDMIDLYRDQQFQALRQTSLMGTEIQLKTATETTELLNSIAHLVETGKVGLTDLDPAIIKGEISDQPSLRTIQGWSGENEELVGLLRKIGGAVRGRIAQGTDNPYPHIQYYKDVLELHGRLQPSDPQVYADKSKFQILIQLLKEAVRHRDKIEAIEKKFRAKFIKDMELTSKGEESKGYKFIENWMNEFNQTDLFNLVKGELLEGNISNELIWHMIATKLSDDFSGTLFPGNYNFGEVGVLITSILETETDLGFKGIIDSLKAISSRSENVEIRKKQKETLSELDVVLTKVGFGRVNENEVEITDRDLRQDISLATINLADRHNARIRKILSENERERRRILLEELPPEDEAIKKGEVYTFNHADAGTPVKYAIWDWDGTISLDYPQEAETLALAHLLWGYKKKKSPLIFADLNQFHDILTDTFTTLLEEYGVSGQRLPRKISQMFDDPVFREKSLEAKLRWFRQNYKLRLVDDTADISKRMWQILDEKILESYPELNGVSEAIRWVERELESKALRDAPTNLRVSRILGIAKDFWHQGYRDRPDLFVQWLRSVVKKEMRDRWEARQTPPLVDGVLAMMQDYQDSGIEQYIGSKGSLSRILDRIKFYEEMGVNLRKYFPADDKKRIYARGGENITDEVLSSESGQVVKPHMIQHVMRDNGILDDFEQVLYIGNWPEDAESADRVGVRSLLIAQERVDLELFLQPNAEYKNGPYLIVYQSFQPEETRKKILDAIRAPKSTDSSKPPQDSLDSLYERVGSDGQSELSQIADHLLGSRRFRNHSVGNFLRVLRNRGRPDKRDGAASAELIFAAVASILLMATIWGFIPLIYFLGGSLFFLPLFVFIFIRSSSPSPTEKAAAKAVARAYEAAKRGKPSARELKLLMKTLTFSFEIAGDSSSTTDRKNPFDVATFERELAQTQSVKTEISDLPEGGLTVLALVNNGFGSTRRNIKLGKAVIDAFVAQSKDRQRGVVVLNPGPVAEKLKAYNRSHKNPVFIEEKPISDRNNLFLSQLDSVLETGGYYDQATQWQILTSQGANPIYDGTLDIRSTRISRAVIKYVNEALEITQRQSVLIRVLLEKAIQIAA